MSSFLEIEKLIRKFDLEMFPLHLLLPHHLIEHLFSHFRPVRSFSFFHSIYVLVMYVALIIWQIVNRCKQTLHSRNVLYVTILL